MLSFSSNDRHPCVLTTPHYAARLSCLPQYPFLADNHYSLLYFLVVNFSSFEKKMSLRGVYKYKCLCVCLCVCTHVHMLSVAHIHVGSHRLSLGMFVYHCLPCLFRHGLSLSLEFTDSAYLASSLQDPPVFRVTDTSPGFPPMCSGNLNWDLDYAETFYRLVCLPISLGTENNVLVSTHQ